MSANNVGPTTESDVFDNGEPDPDEQPSAAQRRLNDRNRSVSPCVADVESPSSD